jgi:isopentenyl-diphosphate delta-isomerase
MTNDIILVDKNDNEIGTGNKLEVHQKGILHRAFSVFVWNKQGQLMMQQRAKEKYHTPGLWSNTCCSHPKPGEDTEAGAHRRLQEEMGFDCELKEEMTVIYHSRFENDLTEHEYDHVFFGHYDGEPNINKEEVHAWEWMTVNELLRDVRVNPDNYTVWFKIILNRLKNENIF